jgi:hypothetical protein
MVRNFCNFHIFHGQVSFPKNVIRTVNILLYNQFKVYTCVLWVFDFLNVLGMLQQPWYTRGHIQIICTLYLFWMHEEIS